MHRDYRIILYEECVNSPDHCWKFGDEDLGSFFCNSWAMSW